MCPEADRTPPLLWSPLDYERDPKFTGDPKSLRLIYRRSFLTYEDKVMRPLWWCQALLLIVSVPCDGTVVPAQQQDTETLRHPLLGRVTTQTTL